MYYYPFAPKTYPFATGPGAIFFPKKSVVITHRVNGHPNRSNFGQKSGEVLVGRDQQRAVFVHRMHKLEQVVHALLVAVHGHDSRGAEQRQVGLQVRPQAGALPSTGSGQAQARIVKPARVAYSWKRGFSFNSRKVSSSTTSLAWSYHHVAQLAAVYLALDAGHHVQHRLVAVP